MKTAPIWGAVAPFTEVMPGAVFWPLVIVVTVLAAVRLTRFVIFDTLGQWLISGPILNWAGWKDEAQYATDEAVLSKVVKDSNPDGLSPKAIHARYMRVARYKRDEPITLASKFASLFDCPWCLGFWVSLAVIGLSVWFYQVPYLAVAWGILMAALSCSYLVGLLADVKVPASDDYDD
nr:MAG TPA: Protein of unknown function (DUF1360) [Caudoviricetes sp.]